MKNQLFIINLANDVVLEDLYETVGKFGEIVSIEMGENDEAGNFGCVTMVNIADANLAANNLNGKKIKGQVVSAIATIDAT